MNPRKQREAARYENLRLAKGLAPVSLPVLHTDDHQQHIEEHMHALGAFTHRVPWWWEYELTALKIVGLHSLGKKRLERRLRALDDRFMERMTEHIAGHIKMQMDAYDFGAMAVEEEVVIYIAGSSAEVFRAVEAHEEAEKLGLPVCSTWTKHVVANRGKGVMDHQLSDDAARAFADRDEEELAEADTLWLLVPNEPSRGCYYELGLFCGWNDGCAGYVVIASGRQAGKHIFERTARIDRVFRVKPHGRAPTPTIQDRHRASDEAALLWLFHNYPERL